MPTIARDFVRGWPCALAVAATVGSIGCGQTRPAPVSPDEAVSVVAPESEITEAAPAIDTGRELRAVRQYYPSLTARSGHATPVLWFVADADNRVIATRRDDADPISASPKEIGRRFPSVDLSQLSAADVFYDPGDATARGPIVVVWAHMGPSSVGTKLANDAMRATAAAAVAHYYGAAASPATGQVREFWFKTSPSGVVLAHGEGRPTTPVAVARGSLFVFAPGELMPDGVRVLWMSD